MACKAFFFLHRLVCRCSIIAKHKGYDYFSLRSWGICEGIKTLNTSRPNVEGCSTGDYDRCPLNHTKECVGTAHSEYVYRQVGKIFVVMSYQGKNTDIIFRMFHSNRMWSLIDITKAGSLETR